ncbi:MAG: hypothetical protein WAO58_07615 [Fimbriimonadaceae bacterium]
MKNQNDMIFSIVAVVLALIVAAVFWATMPQVPAQVAVAPLDTAKATLPAGDVVMSNSLPNAAQAPGGNSAGGGPGGARGGGGGGAPSVGGPQVGRAGGA